MPAEISRRNLQTGSTVSAFGDSFGATDSEQAFVKSIVVVYRGTVLVAFDASVRRGFQIYVESNAVVGVWLEHESPACAQLEHIPIWSPTCSYVFRPKMCTQKNCVVEHVCGSYSL